MSPPSGRGLRLDGSRRTAQESADSDASTSRSTSVSRPDLEEPRLRRTSRIRRCAPTVHQNTEPNALCGQLDGRQPIIGRKNLAPRLGNPTRVDAHQLTRLLPPQRLLGMGGVDLHRHIDDAGVVPRDEVDALTARDPGEVGRVVVVTPPLLTVTFPSLTVTFIDRCRLSWYNVHQPHFSGHAYYPPQPPRSRDVNEPVKRWSFTGNCQ